MLMRIKITKSIILKFINDFKSSHIEEITDLFMNGYCYYFAKILDERFNHYGKIIYIPLYNHFCYKVYNRYYDITGVIEDKNKLKDAIEWDIYKEKYKIEANRIIRDCILKVSR